MLLKKFVALSVLALSACTPNPQPGPASEAVPSSAATPPVVPAARAAAPAPLAAEHDRGAAAALTRIEDPSTVCMINDQHMSVAQIPVQVEGKTYYGCCEMCEAKLKNNPQARLGVDPTTQKPVDKATAVLAMDAKGKVLYFENEDSLQTYASRL